MGSAFTLAFPNKVAEWAVAILAMLRTYSDALTKNRARSRFSYISKTKSPAWMLVTSGSAIIGVYLNEWTI